MRKKQSLIIPFLCMAASLQAQSPTDIKEQFIKDWVRAKEYTGKYLAVMPANKYNLKAADSIRTYAGQMLHIASANIFFGSWATGKPGIYNGFDMEKSAGAQSKDSAIFYVNASYDFVIECIKGLDAAKLNEMATMGKTSATRFSLLLKAFEHQTHHRGQGTIYIRAAGIRPPNEMLF